MIQPIVWFALSALFVIAGLMNLARGLRRTDARRPVNLALALACLVWAVDTLLFRFVSQALGYAVAVGAVAIMCWGALLSARSAQ